MVRRVLHLVRRFVWSLWPAGPGADDERWARSLLTTPEITLWDRMSRTDRRHAVRVARHVDARLDAAPDAALAAALLHDVGKTVARLGTLGRVLATMAATVVSEATASSWSRRRGPIGRLGRYVAYPSLGVELLESAGSDPLVVAWSREHHRPEDRWTVDPALGRILSAADHAA